MEATVTVCPPVAKFAAIANSSRAAPSLPTTVEAARTGVDSTIKSAVAPGCRPATTQMSNAPDLAHRTLDPVQNATKPW